MNDEKTGFDLRVIYLNSFVDVGNYEFFSAVRVESENDRLPVTYLMRDKTTDLVFRQKISFNDYKEKLRFINIIMKN